jgi:hypothetical protein
MALGVAAGLPAAASATDYWAAPASSGSCLSKDDPCKLPTAVEEANTAGDRVILESTGVPFTPNSTLNITHSIDFGGEAGQPPPTIEGTLGTMLANQTAGSSFHDFRIIDPIGDPSLASEKKATFSRIFVSGGFFACEFFGSETVVDSVCWGSSTNGGAMSVFPDSGTHTLTLRNDTIEATGSPSVGFYMIASGGATETIDAANVIAGADGTGIELQANSGATVTASFSNSNFAKAQAFGGTTLLTPSSAAGNQATPPQFDEPAAGDFHEVDGSPTIDAGAADPLIGAEDLDGAPRSQGECVGAAGAPDIGAYEFSPVQPCPGAVPGAGAGSEPPPPSNAVRFGKPRLNRKKGTALLPVGIPDAGSLRLSGAVIFEKPKKGRHGAKRPITSKTVASAMTIELLVKAKGRAARTLAKKGAAKVKVAVTFTPRGGSAATSTDLLKLKKTVGR